MPKHMEIKKIINLTPHPVTLVREDGAAVEIPSAAEKLPRCSETSEQIGEIFIGDLRIPVIRKSLGRVENLPDPEEGTFYIVSLAVAQAARHRRDLLVPNDTVRDEQGKIIGCRSLATVADALED
ncbi:hypothetical protein Tfer_0886 [Thermincola ferriacetica]|uniref:Uncharacterized protein n=1 Tax=Thermincola ferriacetica TaxID=281456 RepID=A0A0L6W4C3_9FIRM|nr:hypothetical protein [Thermincola ferriacetica]KNZ70326.1 hypothetical protein Tfer_0886 [Thermincola ferriacetica]